MKLSSVTWILRYRLLQPVLNFVVSISQQFYWLCIYPLYKAMHSVVWILRWRVIGGLADLLVTASWFVRWRIFHPVVKAVYSMAWVLRWRVLGGLMDLVITASWFVRWRVVHPFVKKLYSARWILRWRVIKPIFDYLQYAVWFLRWRMIYPVLKLTLPSSIVRALYPARARGLVRFLKDLRIKSIPLRSLSQYADETDAPQILLHAAEQVAAPRPSMFPESVGRELSTADQDYEFPPISVHTVAYATVMGRSNMVFADDALHHHSLYRFSHDFTSEELHGKIRILPAKSLVKAYDVVVKKQRLDQAAMFMDSCSSNYAHWLTEVLPKINAYWNGLGDPQDIVLARRLGDDGQAMPLLIDAGLHRNIEDSLLAVVGLDARVLRVANGEQVDVDRLKVTTPTGYVPFDRRSFTLDGHSEGQFSPMALRQLRERLSANLPSPTQKTPKKIFLKRNTKARSMLNAEAIELRLLQEGFVSVSTELMTFAEQFHTFSGADVVVGATGAAFANLIFCKPNAKIVVCIAKFENTSYGYWQNLACASGNKVVYVLGKIAPSLVKSIHSDFGIDEMDLLSALA